MIYFVDDKAHAVAPWLLDLEDRGYRVSTLKNADAAFVTLCDAAADDVELVIIDVMLAVADPKTSRFSRERTATYLETGLCLLEDLCPHNAQVFPDRAVLLTNTSNPTTFAAAEETSDRFEVPLWQKSTMYALTDFGDRVEARIRELG